MKETKISIPLSDPTYEIYGILRAEDNKRPIVVLCHGYGGHMNETLLYMAARYFDKHGFDTLRLSMYGGGEHARNISRSDVMTHAADIDSVVGYLKDSGFEWVGVTGHSYSGMAIVYSSSQQFDAAAMWDPSHTDGYDDPQAIENLEKDFVFVDEIQAYVSGIHAGYVYAKTVFDNRYVSSSPAASRFKIPTLVCNASWSKDMKHYGRTYADTIAAQTKHVVIPDSTHPFLEDGVPAKLYRETVEYFKSTRNG